MHPTKMPVIVVMDNQTQRNPLWNVINRINQSVHHLDWHAVCWSISMAFALKPRSKIQLLLWIWNNVLYYILYNAYIENKAIQRAKAVCVSNLRSLSNELTHLCHGHTLKQACVNAYHAYTLIEWNTTLCMCLSSHSEVEPASEKRKSVFSWTSADNWTHIKSV